MQESDQSDPSEDVSVLHGAGQKLCEESYGEKTTDTILVDTNGDQLVISLKPRQGVDVCVAVRPNVAGSEIEAALALAYDEIRHTRALSPEQGMNDAGDLPKNSSDREIVALDGGER